MREAVSLLPLSEGRRGETEIEDEARRIADSPLLELFRDFPILILIVNDRLQILWANREALRILGADSIQGVAGYRLGEALGCIHSSEGPDGCGTTEYCAFCSAGRCLAAAARGTGGGQESVIRRGQSHNFDSLDLLVWTRPFELDGKRFVAFAAQDRSSQKRREVLERVFYHDLLNTAASIKSLTGLLGQSECASESRELLELADEAAERLVEEIDSQRSLKDAEDGRLAVSMSDADADAILDQALKPFQVYFREKGIRLDRSSPAKEGRLRTDTTLARRVVANMVKNALEASGRGDRIGAGVRAEEDSVEIWVGNSAVLSETERRMIFHRSYSTKGPGRGLGTYGMKLLAERYLGGRVDFESSESGGTVFRMRLPREPSPGDGKQPAG